VSETSNEFIKTDPPVFKTELRDSIKVKGKGQMNVYWLLGRVDSEPVLPPGKSSE
jgi:hypothetical protein